MLDAKFLAESACFFGGGTRIVLELNEYRESIDIDFLCANREGYRELRRGVTQESFGKVFKKKISLLREVRADIYGIRSFLSVQGQPVKFEIIAEGRIPVQGGRIEMLPVSVLDRTTCFAEKLLANADRGRDRSTYSRDIIDLAFMATHWPKADWASAFEIADAAYGEVVQGELTASLGIISDTKWRRQCIDALAVSEPRRLTAGVRVLKGLLKEESKDQAD